MDKETKLKISESQKGQHHSINTEYKKGHPQCNTGRTHFKKGYKHTEEQKKEMSKRMKGNTYAKGKKSWNSGLKGYLAGENNNNWKGGITSINDLIRKSKEYIEWAISVYKRDKYICQECGIKCRANNIIAHHIKPFADYPELRFDTNNGITLCRSCHKKIHKEIGIKTRFKTISVPA
jgi:hypothetical protein